MTALDITLCGLLGALCLVVVLLVLAVYRQQLNHLTHVQVLVAKAEQERRSLLDRIQHPHVRQVDTGDRDVIAESPRDAAEFAQVGAIVPDFVHVGSPEDEVNADG